MSTNFPPPNQSILDAFNFEAYQGNQFNAVLPSFFVGDTDEHPYILLKNSSTSKCLFVNRRILGSDDTLTANYYINPTVTANGSLQTPANFKPASTNMSVASCYFNPTTSAFGKLTTRLWATTGSQTKDENVIILDPGQSMLVTVAAGHIGNLILLELGWYEI